MLIIRLFYSNKFVQADCIRQIEDNEEFVHACFLRPLIDFGKAKLLIDFAQVSFSRKDKRIE